MKKTTKHKYPLVRVVWRDSNMYRFQDSIAYARNNFTVEVIVTVGFLIGYQEKNPIITREILGRGNDQRCTIVIPKENVVSLEKIHGTFKDPWEWAGARSQNVRTENKLPPKKK